MRSVVIAFEPNRLRIDRLGINAPVTQSFSFDHTLNPPEDPASVGWWLASALAGASSGSTVVTGHVDSATRGLGALFNLKNVRAGDLIILSGPGGVATYQVNSLVVYSKGSGLPASVFASKEPRLVLITCGGPFDKDSGSYQDNVVVTAKPVAP